MYLALKFNLVIVNKKKEDKNQAETEKIKSIINLVLSV
jgi:hypothetical protein